MNESEMFCRDFFYMLDNIGQQLKAKKSGFKLIVREDGSGIVEEVKSGVVEYRVLYDFDTLSELVEKFYGGDK
jgi:hypothetical protein